MKDRQIYEMNKKWREYRLEEDKEPITEGVKNELADVMTRYLLGNKKTAVKQLERLRKKFNAEGGMDQEYYGYVYTQFLKVINKVVS
ncbi:hypothetical protein H8D04_00225 [bacterium]|nr:hypothetical protein [bacterium]